MYNTCMCKNSVIENFCLRDLKNVQNRVFEKIAFKAYKHGIESGTKKTITFLILKIFEKFKKIYLYFFKENKMK